MSETINKETCRDYAITEIDNLSEGQKEHYAYRYLHFHLLVEEMGGFANYRHHICNRVFDKEIKKLKQENEKLLKCVEFYTRKISGQQLINEDAESFPLDHNKNLNSYISGKRARQTLKYLKGGE